jgi:hypothetical protein
MIRYVDSGEIVQPQYSAHPCTSIWTDMVQGGRNDRTISPRPGESGFITFVHVTPLDGLSVYLMDSRHGSLDRLLNIVVRKGRQYGGGIIAARDLQHPTTMRHPRRSRDDPTMIKRYDVSEGYDVSGLGQDLIM